MSRDRRESQVLVVFATSLTAILVYLGPPGTDYAAHVYQQGLFAAHGFSLWNNLWYSGRYSFITYSTLYYPIATLLGIRALAVICGGVLAATFIALMGRRWGSSARWAGRSVAVVVPGFVLTAAFPFLLGSSLALIAIASLQSRRWLPFVLLCPLIAAASPLAFVLFGIVVFAIAVAERWDSRAWVPASGVLAAVSGLLLITALAFPSQARYPFPLEAFLPVLGFAAALAGLTWRVESARILRYLAILYAGACVVTFFVASEVGEGITRLRFVAIPLMLLAVALRDWRPRGVVVVAVACAGYWNVAPLVSSFAHGSGDPTEQAAFWLPVTRYLQGHLTPSYRVEVVDTERHWAADYLPAAGIPLVRGWFRQDDFPQNRVLYGGLTRTSYLAWLRALGTRFVVLTNATPDYSAHAEAALLRSGVSGLRPVYRSSDVEIFQVPRSRSILTGPRHPVVLDYARDEMTIRVRARGEYHVAVRFTPYWKASSGCLTRSADGMLALAITNPSIVRIRFAPNLDSVLSVLGWRGHSRCQAAAA